ncbi:selenoprotein M-like isoform X1 [Dendrobates tinctorius]|uniref:selenoprotein M-like isoform X1 n=1 Tax=Dendrobates tinctorius TaxID=92724 RepID=UPI003CCA6A55
MDLKAVLCVLAICLCVNANNSDSVERVLIEDTEIARGTVIEIGKQKKTKHGAPGNSLQSKAPSVVGCAIKSKPGLYKFMLDIFGLYHNLVYDSNDDIEPQIIFYNYKNEVLKITKIKQKSAEEISAILDEAGFYKKSQKGEEVPKEFQHYPLKAPRDEL